MAGAEAGEVAPGLWRGRSRHPWGGDLLKVTEVLNGSFNLNENHTASVKAKGSSTERPVNQTWAPPLTLFLSRIAGLLSAVGLSAASRYSRADTWGRAHGVVGKARGRGWVQVIGVGWGAVQGFALSE